MDVALLSRMIGELILDNDTLGLPGLGSFVVEDMPASFADRGYSINPPYRRLSFVGKVSDDRRLAALYAAGNSLDAKDADSILRSFLEGLGDELRRTKSVELPGLGRLRATREGHIFFVPDESLDISPDTFGLEGVSLKSHSVMPHLPEAPDYCITPAAASTGTKIAQNGPEEPEKDVSGTKNVNFGPSQPETAPVVPETAPAEPETAPAVPEPAPAAAKPAPAPRRQRKPLPAAARWAIGTFCAAAIAIGAFAALARIAPDFTDRLLYTPEQLAIINAPEDGTGLPL